MSIELARWIVGRGRDLVLGQVGAGLRALLPDLPPIEHVPSGRMVDLGPRGRTYVVDIPGPGPDAPTVVLLHGLAATASLCWAPTLAPLSRIARVITFDQRWHGRGIRSPHFTLEECADDVAAVLEALDIPEAVICGYSLGGVVAQMVWYRRPERVSGLVLCSTARNSQGTPGERFFFPIMQAAMRSLREHSHARLEDHAAMIEEPIAFDPEDVESWGLAEMRTISPWALPHAMNAFGQFNSAPWIGGVDVPTAVVVTADDRAVPARRQRKLAEAIPDSALYEAPGGHAALMFGVDRWLPVFLRAVGDVSARSEQRLAV